MQHVVSRLLSTRGRISLKRNRLFLLDDHNNPIGAHIFVKNFSLGPGNDRFYPLGHFKVTEKAKLLPGNLLVKTCPHIFKTPSTVFSVINIYGNPFSHFGLLSVAN